MMQNSQRSAPRRRNPVTRAKIRQDTLWQMLVPLAVALLVFIVLMVLVILPGGAAVRSPLADVSLMILIIPSAIGALLVLALLLGLNYVLFLGVTRLPPYFKIAQDWVAMLADRIQTGAKSVSDVVLKIRSTLAGAKRAAEDVRGFLTFRR
ncbi:MAG: hypothetical protein ABI847_13585 [Anaerolineales bacterium]